MAEYGTVGGDFTAAGVVPCGSRKTSPNTSSLCTLYFLVLWAH